MSLSVSWCLPHLDSAAAFAAVAACCVFVGFVFGVWGLRYGDGCPQIRVSLREPLSLLCLFLPRLLSLFVASLSLSQLLIFILLWLAS